jgi:hypothetical protein
VALSADNIVQKNKGFTDANASVVVTLPSGTTAGNAVLVFLFSTSGITAGNVAAGFTTGVAAVNTASFYYQTDMAAGETSWTFTTTSAVDSAWVAVEMSNIDIVDPYEVTALASGVTLSTGATHSTGTTPTNYGLSTMQFACFGTYTSSVDKSWAGYTNGFEEVDQIAADGTHAVGLAVAANYATGAPGTYECTATVTIASGTSTCRGRLVVVREAGSPISAPLASLIGFEFGTHGGLAEDTIHTSGANQIFGGGTQGTDVVVGTWGTQYAISASYARASDYGFRITTSAGTCSAPLFEPTTAAPSYGMNVRVVSGSGTPTVLTFRPTVGTDLLLIYEVSSERFGLRWGAGSVSWQTGTTPLNTWAWIELRVKVSATTHRADWWIETGDGLQTSPAYLTGMTSTSMSLSRMGSLTSQTATIDYDDVVVSSHYAAFPMGTHKVIALGVDTGGTATVSGTAANFKVFTANGTLGAFDSAACLAALDERPPTVSAAADGLVQVTTAASDYVELPMQTYTLAADEVIAGLRVVASMWSGAGAGAGHLQIKGWDGTTETILVPQTTTTLTWDAESPTALSSTRPLWMARMYKATPGVPWTQAQLNTMTLRMGYSTDATPTMGISAIYLEVAIRKTVPFVAHRLTDDEDPEVNAAVVTELLHPYSSGVRTYTVSNDDPTRTAVFNYSIGGTPQTPVVVAPSDPPVDVTVGAEAFGEVDSTSFGWQ